MAEVASPRPATPKRPPNIAPPTPDALQSLNGPIANARKHESARDKGTFKLISEARSLGSLPASFISQPQRC
jgi:hypothetical protein